MATIASVHTDAIALQGVVTTVTAELNRAYGNIAAGKLNRVGSGLAALVADLATLDVELLRAAQQPAERKRVKEDFHGSDHRTEK